MGLRLTLILLVAGLLALGTAHASFFTPVQYFGMTIGDFQTTHPDAGGSSYAIGAPIRGFDTSLGNLVGVTVSVYGMDNAGFITSTNDDTSDHNVTATYNSDFSGSAPAPVPMERLVMTSTR